jgi:hypothetical protein
LPFGIALHDYIAGRRPWAQLDRILEQLPRHSHYKAALEDDEEYAEIALVLDGLTSSQRKARVPLAGYDEVAVRLDNLFDAINAVNETLLAAPHFKRRGGRQAVRAPRPETAQQRLKRHQSITRINSIVEQMTGGR